MENYLATWKPIKQMFLNWLSKSIQDAGNQILENLDDNTIPLYEINRIMALIRHEPKPFLCKICQLFTAVDKDCEICITLRK